MREFDIDAHLDLVESSPALPLSQLRKEDLIDLLSRPSLLRVQKELLLVINGEMNRLSTADLTKEQALLAMARVQGKIAGIRSFFDVVTELCNAAAQETTDARI